MKFGQLDIDPAENPGVLDTGTWDVAAACEQVRVAKYDWVAAANAFRRGTAPPTADAIPADGARTTRASGPLLLPAAAADGRLRL